MDDISPVNPPGLTPSPQALNAVERYDGKQDPNAWISSITEVAELYGWDDATCLKVAKIRLQGAARTWAQPRTFSDWYEFHRQLDHRFGETKETAIARLERCNQGRNETPKAFADRFLQAAEKAGRAEDDALVYTFIQRLQANLRTEVARQRLHSIDEIVTFCNYWIGLQGPDRENNLSFSENSQDPPRAGIAPPKRQNNENTYTGSNFRKFERNNGSFRPALRDNNNRPPPTPVSNKMVPPGPKPAVRPVSSDEVSDLTKRFQKLELNVHQQQQYHQQQLQEKDREIRTLRYALQKQQDPHQINLMGDEGPTYMYSENFRPLEDPTDDQDIDHDLLASLLVDQPNQ